MSLINILVISNWSISEGIGRSTLSHLLYFLEQDERVAKVILTSIEKQEPNQVFSGKVVFRPMTIGQLNAFNRVTNFYKQIIFLTKMIKDHRIDFIWSKGSGAGVVGIVLRILRGTPLVVDSFEPHSLYMLETKTWSRFGVKFTVQAFAEYLMKKYSFALLPVSFAYYSRLLKQGVDPNKIKVVPCVVDVLQFKYDQQRRFQIRKEIGVTESNIVGIYVGKFGGLYYDKLAFQLFDSAFRFWGEKFYLIILTEMEPSNLQKFYKATSMSMERVLIRKVDHEHIPLYLSGADFAFSTIKSVQAMTFCSPIKHGEYWAADLPILSTLKYGDDSEIIRNENGGFIIDHQDDNLKSIFMQIDNVLKNGRTGRFAQLAKKYRDNIRINEALGFVLSKFLLSKN